MLMGWIGGTVLLSSRPTQWRMGWFAAAGIAAMALGIVLDATGVCPMVKRIWTPSWTLFSGGLCFLALAGFHLVCDVMEIRGPFLPLVVLGANSMAAYMVAHLWPEFIGKSLVRHLPNNAFSVLGTQWQVPLLGICVLLIEWLILWWLYRRKIFLKI
jgi:predicted acyltransferase